MEKPQETVNLIEKDGLSLASVAPLHYAISIFPYPKSNAIQGTVQISIEIREPKGVSQLSLNASLLTDISAQYKNGGIVNYARVHCTDEIVSLDFSPAVLPVRCSRVLFVKGRKVVSWKYSRFSG